MDNYSKPNETNLIVDIPANLIDRQATYEQYGKEQAKKMEANIESLEGSLDHVYERFLKEQRLDADGIKSRIKRIQDEILQVKSQNERLSNDLILIKKKGEIIEIKIEELTGEKTKMIEGQVEPVLMPYIISLLITLLLTLYLFVFYSSAAYSVFYGIKPGNGGIINPDVYGDAMEKGGGAIAIVLLFPVIFIGMGFLISDALFKKTYNFIYGLISITFTADFIIGFKTAESLYTNKYNAGVVNNAWQFSMIFISVDFYLILFLGFAVYIIWGFLLNYVLDKNKEMQPEVASDLKKEIINKKIADQQNLLQDNNAIANSNKENMASNDNLLIAKQKDISGYQNGVTPVNISLLLASVADFMAGWYAYINLMFINEASSMILKSKEKQQCWIKIKLDTLDTDQ